MSDGLKYLLLTMVIFAVVIFGTGMATKRADLADCKDLRALYGDVVFWETKPFSTTCYAVMPDGNFFELDLYGINDHILLREITK